MSKRTCSFPGCERIHSSRGLCHGHARQRNLGFDLSPILPQGAVPLPERFAARVQKSDDCWLWQGSRLSGGYGQIRSDDNKMVLAHRVAWELATGETIPKGMVIDHLCHVPACVRPDHLQVVSQKQNAENATQRASFSGVRGVTWVERERKWEARVSHNRVQYHCGKYESLAEAGEAARKKRLELFTNNQHDLVHA